MLAIMLHNLLKRKHDPEQDHVPEPNPYDDFTAARREWFEQYGAVAVDRNRWVAAATVLGICVLLLSVAIIVMMPLKTVQPYVVKVAESGFVSVDRAAAQRYQPGSAEKQYFIAQWVKKLFTLDRSLTQKYLPEAYGFTTDKATSQFKEFIASDRPIEQLVENPSVSRDAIIHSVSFISEDVALVRFTAEKRIGTDLQRRNMLLTIRFEIAPPRTDEEILRNPIGLQIVHFTLNEDIQGKS